MTIGCWGHHMGITDCMARLPLLHARLAPGMRTGGPESVSTDPGSPTHAGGPDGPAEGDTGPGIMHGRPCREAPACTEPDGHSGPHLLSVW